MKSRREFVISQGWGTSSGLQALARIQLVRRRDTYQRRGRLVEVSTDEVNVSYDADEIAESADRP
jgi:dTDP-D-glucose 4,6-dehydratase